MFLLVEALVMNDGTNAVSAPKSVPQSFGMFVMAGLREEGFEVEVFFMPSGKRISSSTNSWYVFSEARSRATARM